MARRHGVPGAGLAAGSILAVWLLSGAAPAATLPVEPGPGALRAAIAAAAPGDTVRLAAGIYHGPVTVDRPLVLEGEPGAVVDGGGRGRVLSIAAPDVTLRGLTVRNSGASLAEMDAGVFVEKTGHRARIEDNRLEGNLFGAYLLGAEDVVFRRNVVVGRKDLRVNERGNGVQVWNSPGSEIADNDFSFGRDGIFVTTSRENVFRDNRFRDLRFAIHYMYTNDSEVSGNVSTGNHVGYALMFSRRLRVRGNLSEDDRDHGIMLNYANESVIEGNVVRRGKTKCAFVYNSNKNVFRGNRFEGCGIGMHFTAGSERNTIAGNAFIDNRTQVKYVGTRWLEWSHDGRGNYWSDNPAFDLDGDGIADSAYRPNDLVDQILWTAPLAKLLLTSPAVQVLRWTQAQFPALRPGGVVDSAPLMRPPEAPLPARAGSSG